MKHTLEEAKRIQEEFEREFGSRSGIAGIGIGLNSDKTDLALNVYVTTREVQKSLPEDYRGLDVVVDETEGFQAF